MAKGEVEEGCVKSELDHREKESFRERKSKQQTVILAKCFL